MVRTEVPGRELFHEVACRARDRATSLDHRLFLLLVEVESIPGDNEVLKRLVSEFTEGLVGLDDDTGEVVRLDSDRFVLFTSGASSSVAHVLARHIYTATAHSLPDLQLTFGYAEVAVQAPFGVALQAAATDARYDR